MYKQSKSTGATKFILKSGGAKTIQVAGDFSQWKPIPMAKQRDGSFAAEVPLTTGKHQYKFIVDGNWVEDPDNKTKTTNAFGSANSVAQL